MAAEKGAETLADLGEFRVLREVVIATLQADGSASHLGDDCAAIDLPGGSKGLVVTADAAPKPAVWYLGVEDYYTWGWYAVVANASDLVPGDYGAFYRGVERAVRERSAPPVTVEEAAYVLDVIAAASESAGQGVVVTV